MVSKRDLNSAELATMRTSKSPTTVMTANGEVQTREEATVYVEQLDLFVTVMLLEETPAVLSLGKLCEDHGYTYYWTSCQKPHLTKKRKRIDCNISNYVPFVVPGLSTSSFTTPTPISPSSSSQDSVFVVNRYTENPVPERSGSTSEELQGNPLHGPTETENTNQMKDAKKYRPIYCMTCRTGHRISERIWSMKVVLQSHGETLSVDIETLPVLLMKYQWRREQKWNWVRVSIVSTRTFPKDPNCDICLKTNNEGFLQKTCWYSRAQSRKLWWLNNRRSHNSQWRKWIAEQSSICRGGTRCGNSVVTILPM